MSRGDSETSKLRENIENQLKRLLTQLQDIEEMKEELDSEEYDSSRQETIDQLKEFEVSLSKMISGDISLVDQIGSVQIAIQTAIRSVTSPEILNMFLKKENNGLRIRLASLDSDLKLGRIAHDAYFSQAGDILKLLDKLGEELSLGEREILQKQQKNLEGYETANDEIASSSVIATASRQITDNNKK